MLPCASGDDKSQLTVFLIPTFPELDGVVIFMDALPTLWLAVSMTAEYPGAVPLIVQPLNDSKSSRKIPGPSCRFRGRAQITERGRDLLINIRTCRIARRRGAAPF
jgi:hypothetical protein